MSIGGRGWRAAGGGMAAAILVVGAGCAQESGVDLLAAGPTEFAATPQFLRATVKRSTEDAFRFEMTMSMAVDDGGEGLDIEVPFLTGAQDGERFRAEMNLGAMAEQMGEAVDPGDLPPGFDMGIEMVGDAETMYIRAPMFAALATEPLPSDGLPPQMTAAFEAFAEMGDRWGRVDLSALGDIAPDQVRSSVSSGQGMDPMALFEILAGTDDVDDLGRSEVDGEPVHGLAAQVSLRELMEAQGTDPEDLAQQVAGTDEFPEAVFDTEMSIEVWIDDDGLVRRLAFAYGPELFEATDEFEGAEFGFSFDFFDYGEPVDIEFPDPSETVDVTEAFTTLAELNQP